MKDLVFFDCNAFIGLPLVRPLSPVFSTDEFLDEMRSAGVSKALVYHVSQWEYSASDGNRLLGEEIASHDNLFGCATILPDASAESLAPDALLAWMKAHRMAALRAFPGAHGFRLDADHCGALLAAASERRVPLLLSIRRGIDCVAVQALLREYPELVCVLCDHSEWAVDREVVSLLDRFANLSIDTTFYGLHGMIETLARRFGAHRILFGSGFPLTPFAAGAYEIAGVDLPHDDRAAIAGGNLARLLEEACL